MEYKIVYNYDDSGEKVNSKSYDENDDLVFSYEYKYDSNGNLVNEKKFNGGDEQVGVIQYVYKYF